MPYRSIRARNPGASSPDRQRADRAGAGACGESKYSASRGSRSILCVRRPRTISSPGWRDLRRWTVPQSSATTSDPFHAFQRPDRLLRLREAVPRQRRQDQGQGDPPSRAATIQERIAFRRRQEPLARLAADVHPRRNGAGEVPEERLREHGVGIARHGAAQRLFEGDLPAKDRGRRGGEEGEGDPHLHAVSRTLPRRRLPAGAGSGASGRAPYRCWTRKCVRTASPGVSSFFSSFIVSVS